MMVVITGGSASGKSVYAENLARELADNSLIYIATMEPFGEEGKQRIKRHREQRQGKGFETIECYRHVEQVSVQKDSTILLECMSNLLANEMFGPDSQVLHERIMEMVFEGVCSLQQTCRHLVIVTNEVFSDGQSYDVSTNRYIEMLGKLNTRLAERADEVFEIVYGIPISLKGRAKA